MASLVERIARRDAEREQARDEVAAARMEARSARLAGDEEAALLHEGLARAWERRLVAR